jgi:hypothetical protein
MQREHGGAGQARPPAQTKLPPQQPDAQRGQRVQDNVGQVIANRVHAPQRVFQAKGE